MLTQKDHLIIALTGLIEVVIDEIIDDDRQNFRKRMFLLKSMCELFKEFGDTFPPTQDWLMEWSAKGLNMIETNELINSINKKTNDK